MTKKRYKIVIEAYALRNRYVGLGEFCYRLGLEIGKQAALYREQYGIEFCFIVPPAHKGCFGKDVTYWAVPKICRYFMSLYPGKVDLFHMPHQYCHFKYLPTAQNKLMTIHDINFIYEKQGSKLQRAINRFKGKLKRADYLNYISQFAKQDTEAHFPVNLPNRVIYNGVTTPDTTLPVTESFRNKLPGKPFFFHISSLLPKKNIHLLVDMMQHLPNETLVIAGSWDNGYAQELLRKIQSTPIPNIIPLFKVSEAEKYYLFDHCKAFFFPSVCEGFGLPPIEAMKLGKPVFLSTRTSLPEIGGSVAQYWNDLTPQVMSRDVANYFKENPTPNAQAIRSHADQYTWERCAQAYLTYYLDILKLR